MKNRLSFARIAIAVFAVSAVLLLARHAGARGTAFALMAVGTVGTAAVVRDGVLPHGSFDVTILETGTGYVFNNFTLQRNSKDISSASARGRTSRQKTILTDVSFSAEAQLLDESTLSPENRQTFAIDADRDGNVEPYQVSKAGDTYTQDAEYKCKVDGKAMVAPLLYDATSTPTAFAPASAAHASPITPATIGVYLPRGMTKGTFSSSGLPTGLSIDGSTGIISGTPTTAATYTFTVKCTGTRTVEGVVETITGAIKGSWLIT